MRLLLTGIPGIGKTTVIRAVVGRLGGIRCAGFYTREARTAGQRTGFEVHTLDGKEAVLASARGGEGPKVGRYAVHLESFERVALPLIDPEQTRAELYVIDEIGRMELLSKRFRERLDALLSSPAHLLATIAKKGAGLVAEIKKRGDVEMIEVTRQNRDELPDVLAKRIREQLSSD